MLEMRAKEPIKPRDRQAWADYVKSRRLAPDWESQLDQHVPNYVSDVFVQQVCHPSRAWGMYCWGHIGFTTDHSLVSSLS